ncbi:hypothetical protein K461DRAFT_278805, partial [Myriangium duriaei CBS 260.36]
MSSLLPWNSNRDEELGKRDDNYRPSTRYHSPAPWTPTHAAHPKTQLRWRRKRLVYIFLVLAGLYLFFFRDSSRTSRGIGLSGRRHVIGGSDFGRSQDESHYGSVSPKAPKGPPPRAGSKSKAKTNTGAGLGGLPGDEEDHYYSGPIKFYNLKSSLDAIGRTSGHRDTNRNVLFAASSLKSVANLLPLVCEMAKLGRNHVHLILLGRAALPIDDVLEINGVDKKTCKAWFHDGRPDYSEYSTDIRAEASVVGAMYHVNSWMHPQVMIVDDEGVEDGFFIRGVRGKMRDLNRPVIEIPYGRYNDFRWLTRLSSASLSSWHTPRLEILVHSPPNAGGGLARLLKSLASADFGGFHTPKLTIELPSQTDGPLASFLSNFAWPPNARNGESDMFKIQKRIPSARMSSEESSIRFVESYYPTHTQDDHVLVLSPNAELSPSFYHYLMYTLLQSRYSAYGAEQREHLAGLTLAAPSSLLDGVTAFKPPAMDAVKERHLDDYKPSDKDDSTSPSFLWQAPSSDAVLIFGNRWAEFHDYLTRRLRSLHEHPDAKRPRKLVSTQHPAWLEFLVELVRARAWTFLYPPDSHAGTLTTIHKELHQTPEEYRSRKDPKSDSVKDDDRHSVKHGQDEPFLVAQDSSPLLVQPERLVSVASQPLHELLPFNGELPDLEDLPLLSLEGETLEHLEDAISQAEKYVTAFRSNLGGCSKSQAQEPTKRLAGRTGDLFCFSGKESKDYVLQDLDLDLLSPDARYDETDIEESVRKNKRKGPRPVEELQGRNKADAREEQDKKLEKIGVDEKD